MSQAKVDRYKTEKANRKKTLAINKFKKRLATVLCSAAVVALAGWAGYGLYQNYEANKPAETFYCDTSAIDDYLASVSGK